MLKVQVWDKTSAINGVEATEVIKSFNIKDTDEIFLVLNDVSHKVEQIQFKSIICGNFGISMDLTCQEVGERYLEVMEEQRIAAEEAAKQEQQRKDEQAAQIEELNNTVAMLVVNSVNTEEANDGLEGLDDLEGIE